MPRPPYQTYDRNSNRVKRNAYIHSLATKVFFITESAVRIGRNDNGDDWSIANIRELTEEIQFQCSGNENIIFEKLVGQFNNALKQHAYECYLNEIDFDYDSFHIANQELTIIPVAPDGSNIQEILANERFGASIKVNVTPKTNARWYVVISQEGMAILIYSRDLGIEEQESGLIVTGQSFLTFTVCRSLLTNRIESAVTNQVYEQFIDDN